MNIERDYAVGTTNGNKTQVDLGMVEAGRIAAQLLDKWTPNVQGEMYQLLREIAGVELTDSRDRLIMQAGYLRALFALVKGFEQKISLGKIAEDRIGHMKDDGIVEVPLA